MKHEVLNETKFNPKPWVRNPHLQTIIASMRFRNMRKQSIIYHSREIIVEGNDGVRLLGYHAGQASRPSKGLIIFIHGWEGSAASAYVVSASHYFFSRGYDVFRLNLRDHGESHHLNEGLFHGALLEETFSAVENIAKLLPGLPCYLVGYSLGGNFALRIAAKQGEVAKDFLKRVFAVSPVIDPYKSTAALDRNFFLYRIYFLRKWQRSLRRKQSLFAQYEFSRLLGLQSCLAMTEVMVDEYTEFKDLTDYFGRYTLNRSWFAKLSLPVTVIAAADDPLIDPVDFVQFEDLPYLTLKIERYGGHCGFLSDLTFRCWAEEEIGRILSQESPG